MIIDLSEVEMITSIGVGLLLENANALKRHAMPMILVNPRGRVEEVLKIAHVDKVLPIEQDVPAAILRIRG